LIKLAISGIISVVMITGRANLSALPEFDPAHMFIGLIPHMVDQARTAAHTDAHSYRDFHVGAAGFVFNPSTHETAILTAGNLKARKHTAKVCAERKVLEQAKKAGYLQAAGIVVAATTDVELIKDVSGVATETLHPCHDCQHFFHEHPLMANDTVIVSIGMDVDRYQVQTFEELANNYSSDDSTQLENLPCGFGFEGWEHRVAMYDYLSIAERQLAENQRRPIGKLVQMALLA
jgi:cytidine deaminase